MSINSTTCACGTQTPGTVTTNAEVTSLDKKIDDLTKLVTNNITEQKTAAAERLKAELAPLVTNAAKLYELPEASFSALSREELTAAIAKKTHAGGTTDFRAHAGTIPGGDAGNVHRALGQPKGGA